MPERIKVAIIGTGGISGLHIAGYEKLPDKVEVVACCDIDEEKAKKYAAAHNIPRVYTDFNEMLDKEQLDAVSVTTWNAAHCAPTCAALEHGVNVICEKPMAMNRFEAMKMQEAAKKSGKLLQIGFVRRYGNDTATVKKFIDSGDMGDLYYAKVEYLRRSGCPGGWFADKDYSGGGPLIDLGVHVMDLARYLAGRPKPVRAFARTFSGLGNNRAAASAMAWQPPENKGQFKANVEDFVTGMILFDTGFTLSVEASFNLNIKSNHSTVQLFGTQAGAQLEGGPLEIYTQKNGLFLNISPDYKSNPFGEIFDREIAHFVDCVMNGTECIAPAEDGVVLMKMIDALYESARTGVSVDID